MHTYLNTFPHCIMLNIPHGPPETPLESFVVLIRRVLSPACFSNLINSLFRSHHHHLLPPSAALPALYPLHLSALKISKRKIPESGSEWGRGIDRERKRGEIEGSPWDEKGSLGGLLWLERRQRAGIKERSVSKGLDDTMLWEQTLANISLGSVTWLFYLGV